MFLGFFPSCPFVSFVVEKKIPVKNGRAKTLLFSVTLLPCGLWQNGLLQEVYYVLTRSASGLCVSKGLMNFKLGYGMTVLCAQRKPT
jgi:hypothetical protein